MLSTLSTASRVFVIKNSSFNQVKLQSGAIKSFFSTLAKHNESNIINVGSRQRSLNLKPQTRSLRARVERVERAEPIRTTRDHVNTMHNYGMLSLGCAGTIGIGTLCYYGLGLGNAEGALERSVLWPQYVKDRIRSTYLHLGSGMAISVAGAYMALKSPALMNLMSSGSLVVAFGSMAALIASSMVAQSIPYEPGFGIKQMAWIGHSALLGAVLAPLSFVGGPVLIRAATYTAGMVGGLSAIAICAPSERFLTSSAPLGIGLGAVVASSIGSLFFSPASKIGLGLYGISLYGGLIVFSGLLVYDTQKTIKKAELHPAYTAAPFDPINNSIHIYMDIVNIFIRLVQIFAGTQRRK